ncbi:cellobiose phosphorylase [Leptospira bouyouniensis]|nr:cellobiose phosphorylase [Leptospira bouyouniensis]
MMIILKNKSGLNVHFFSNVSLHSIYLNDTLMNLYFGNEMDQSVFNLTLEYRLESKTKSIALFSPIGSPLIQTSERKVTISRKIDSLNIITKFEIHSIQNIWQVQTTIQNQSNNLIPISLVYTQDIGLCDPNSAKLNEAFVSQYIHHEVIQNQTYGTSILSRQNELVFGKHPASFTFSDQKVSSYATDGRDIFEQGKLKPFQNRRYQGEHSIIGLGTEETVLQPQETVVSHFYTFLIENLDRIETFFSQPYEPKSMLDDWEYDISPVEITLVPNISLFHHRKNGNGNKVNENTLKLQFANPWRNVERSQDGSILSFFTDEDTYVSLLQKEILCKRPHGQLLRTGVNLTPEESSLTSTSYFNGLFISQLTQGHTSINQLLSRKSGDLGTNQSKGLRIFIKVKGEWICLENPSFLVFQPSSLKWVYFFNNESIQIQLNANDNDSFTINFSHDFSNPLEVIFSFATSLDGDNGNLPFPLTINKSTHSITVSPNQNSTIFERFNGKGFRIETDSIANLNVSDDRMLFESNQSLNLPYLTISTEIQSSITFHIFGELQVEKRAKKTSFNNEYLIQYRSLLNSAKKANNQSFLEMIEILPWFKQNAEIHYLNPRGLEQFSGGGWGTRDVCQGAFEYLLTSGNFSAIRDLCIRVFSEQNEDGDWPQWFMLYERDKHIRADDSHGDILYWPIICILIYLERTDNFSILEETTSNQVRINKRKIAEGIEITLKEILNRFIPNTVLPKYGNGDWNDSMQPKEKNFRDEAVSPWTAELQIILFQKLVWYYQILGNEEKKNFYLSLSNTLSFQIRENCMESGIIAGLIQFSSNGEKEFLLHPKDKVSSIRYSILPMIYGIISNVFTKDEAEFHLKIIESHLTGPDGVRLFDKPVPYKNGQSTFFKRAETASFFGREIGLMYTHAHLRYCEALAEMGKSQEFFKQLNLINPIGIRNRIPSCEIRQSNCYYSSSDGVFLDRTDAETNYNKLLRGEIPLEGGWRVYSSGPGIFLKLFYETLLGIQIQKNGIIFDPILPIDLNGLNIEADFFSTKFNLKYEVKSINGLIHSIKLNGKKISAKRMPHQYRTGGLKITKEQLLSEIKSEKNTLEILIQ